jgi:hypothetical protein
MEPPTTPKEHTVAQGKTTSPLKLSLRKEKAFELYARGFRIADVARDIQVAWTTASRYRDAYDQAIAAQAADNPELLSDVIANTFRSIKECDETRRAAWDRYQKATTDQSRAAFLSLAMKANIDRAKLIGLLGVKPEYAARMEAVRSQQARLIEFMNTEMCALDRERLIAYLEKDMGNQLQELPTADEVVYDRLA